MENFSNEPSLPSRFTHIKGWGIDADPNNEPTYPMRHRTEGEHEGYRWERPPQQPLEVEVLHSNERPNVTAVYGTTAPPSGLSGILRRRAFKYSEGTYGHWLLLLLADRINVLEGIVDDLQRGHMPNLLAERGMKAEWRYNRPAVVKKAAVATALVAGAVVLIRMNRRR